MIDGHERQTGTLILSLSPNLQLQGDMDTHMQVGERERARGDLEGIERRS